MSIRLHHVGIVVADLGQRAHSLALPDVTRLTRRLQQLGEPTEPVRAWW